MNTRSHSCDTSEAFSYGDGWFYLKKFVKKKQIVNYANVQMFVPSTYLNSIMRFFPYPVSIAFRGT